MISLPANYVLLERIELNASAASVTFASIPQSGYTDLKIVVSARSNRADTDDIILMKPNNSSSNLTYRALTANGSTASSGTLNRFYVDGDTFTANTFANVEIYIPNFTSSSYKSWSLDSVTENNGTTAYSALMAGLWSDTTAISSLVFAPIYGTAFTANSTFSLYGLAAVGTTPVIAPKATGGNLIENDGTYWIHTFTSTGTFTPLQGLSCDTLVVAGGGGGTGISSGGGAGGPGGGAGGFRTSTGFSVAAQAYTITVGAGGAGGIGGSAGSNGTDSIFSTITSTGGGGGGNNNGASGGSGGGARYNGTVGAGNTPSTSPSQGSNGGLGGGALTWQGGGGGGGASAVGSAGTGSNSNVAVFGGNGGAGTANSYSGSSVTYAGGGGGGVYADPPSASAAGTGGAGGGGNGGWEANGSNGTANRGGGGGGTGRKTGTAYNGGTGGSGIVIIRYPIN